MYNPLGEKIKMGNFKSYALLAAVGSLLMCTLYMSIPGIILVFIAMKGLAEHYKDDNIVKGLVNGVIFGIVGLAALVIGGIGSILSYALSYNSYNAFDTSSGSILVAIVSLIIAFVFMVLMALNFRNALNALSDRSGEPLFRTAGTFMFYGALLTILLVGILALEVAFITMIVAFYALFKVDTNKQPANQTPSAATWAPVNDTTANTENKFCPYCGTSAASGTSFCTKCGKQI